MLTVNQQVTYTGDPETGTILEIWRGKRARVQWSSGLEVWVPLHSLSPADKPATTAPGRRRCEECGALIPGNSHADDVADGRMPGYCRNC